MRRYAQLVIFFLCVFASVAALYNVYSDNAATEALAFSVACGGARDCAPVITSMMRTPFGQELTIQTRPPRGETVPVACVRSLYLVGDYTCTRR